MYSPMPMSHIDWDHRSCTLRMFHRYLIARLATGLRYLAVQGPHSNWREGLENCLDHLLKCYGIATITGITLPSSYVLQELITSFYPAQRPDDEIWRSVSLVINALATISDVELDQNLCKDKNSASIPFAWWNHGEADTPMPSYVAVQSVFEKKFVRYIQGGWTRKNDPLDDVVFKPHSADAELPILREWLFKDPDRGVGSGHQSRQVHPTSSAAKGGLRHKEGSTELAEALDEAVHELKLLKADWYGIRAQVSANKSRLAEAVCRSSLAVQVYPELARRSKESNGIPFPIPAHRFRSDFIGYPQFLDTNDEQNKLGTGLSGSSKAQPTSNLNSSINNDTG